MMQSTLKRLFGDQRGLTLVELLIAFLLAGIVTAGITVTMGHLLTGSTRTSNHMTAVRQVQTAGYWVSQDALQSREFDLSEGSGFPLTLTIPYRVDQSGDWVEKELTVVYDVVEGRLIRIYHDEDSAPITSIVAQHIVAVDPDTSEVATSIERTDDGVYVFQVTATVGAMSVYEATEVRVYRIDPRPDG